MVKYPSKVLKKLLITNAPTKTTKSLEKILGQKNLRDMCFIATELRRIRSKEAAILNKISKLVTKTDGVTDIENESMVDQIYSSIEDLLYISQSVQTDNLFKLPIQELAGLNKEASTRTGYIKTWNVIEDYIS